MRLVTSALAVAAMLALAACSGASTSTVNDGDTPPEQTSVSASDHVIVDVERRSFAPDEVTVTVGGTVEWRWDDSGVDHDVVGDGFRSPVIDSGVFEHTFTEPGTYEYVCTLHRGMDGVVEVVDV